MVQSKRPPEQTLGNWDLIIDRIAKLEEALVKAGFAVDAENLQLLVDDGLSNGLIPVEDHEIRHWIPVYQIAEVLMRLCEVGPVHDENRT
jgi:hypothetical protein